MVSAPRDANGIPTMLGTLNTDGSTPVSIKVATNGRVHTSNGVGGTDHSGVNDIRDANRIPALMGISSVDGTPVEIYADLTGALLTQST